MKKSYVLFGLIALFVLYAGWAFADSITPYVDIAEARSAHGSVQVKGRSIRMLPHPRRRGRISSSDSSMNQEKKWKCIITAQSLINFARRITSSPSVRTRTARSRRIGCSSSVRRSMKR